MTEESTHATDADAQPTCWRCERCGAQLGSLLGSMCVVLRECTVRLYPRIVLVTCPRCGTTNKYRPAR